MGPDRSVQELGDAVARRVLGASAQRVARIDPEGAADGDLGCDLEEHLVARVHMRGVALVQREVQLVRRTYGSIRRTPLRTTRKSLDRIRLPLPESVVWQHEPRADGGLHARCGEVLA